MSPMILAVPTILPSRRPSDFPGDGGTTSATGLPKRVTRIGRRVLRTSSRMPRHLALNSEIAISFMLASYHSQRPWSYLCFACPGMRSLRIPASNCETGALAGRRSGICQRGGRFPSTKKFFRAAGKFRKSTKLSFLGCADRFRAQAASGKYLLTEDLQADQDFDGVIVVNPIRCNAVQIIGE